MSLGLTVVTTSLGFKTYNCWQPLARELTLRHCSRYTTCLKERQASVWTVLEKTKADSTELRQELLKQHLRSYVRSSVLVILWSVRENPVSLSVPLVLHGWSGFLALLHAVPQRSFKGFNQWEEAAVLSVLSYSNRLQDAVLFDFGSAVPVCSGFRSGHGSKPSDNQLSVMLPPSMIVTGSSMR